MSDAGGSPEPVQPLQLLAPTPSASGSRRRTPRRPTPTWATSFALMGKCRRDGPWTIGAHHTAFALLGSVVLDLCEVRFPAGEVVIDASAVMGGVEVRRTGPPGDRRAAIGSNP